MADTWQERCRAKGGFPVASPTGEPGVMACKFYLPDGKPVYSSADMTMSEWFKHWTGILNERDDMLDGVWIRPVDDLARKVNDAPLDILKAFFKSPVALAAAGVLIVLNLPAIITAAKTVRRAFK